jgi:3-oxoacyl-ACP reductase-like protein
MFGSYRYCTGSTSSSQQEEQVMGIFDTIKNAIFGRRRPAAPTATQTSAPAAPTPTVAAAPAAAPAPAAMDAVDVAEMLEDMAAEAGQKLNWRTSIVDLMKLVGMDSSLAERKELAGELGYTGDMGDSASMNIWLHKAVMKALAENGGKVPADLLD